MEKTNFPVSLAMDTPGRIHHLGARLGVPITVRPTKADVAIARGVASNTAPAPEEVARALTWGADEKVLLILAAAGWLYLAWMRRAAAARR